jgi:hypothetical protein
MEPTHLPDFTGARIFLNLFISGFSDDILSVVGDMPVANEASVVTLSISRFVGST